MSNLGGLQRAVKPGIRGSRCRGAGQTTPRLHIPSNGRALETIPVEAMCWRWMGANTFTTNFVRLRLQVYDLGRGPERAHVRRARVRNTGLDSI